MTIDSNTGGTLYTPPDTCGAASSGTTYIETVNQQVTIYNNSTGATTAADNFDHFFLTTGGLSHVDASSSLFDPSITYDDQIGRFVVSDMDYDFGSGHKSAFNFAVSKSADPATLTAADWSFYQINTTENDGTASGTFDADYPGNLGWNHDAFVFTLNMFAADGSSAHVQVNSVSISDLVNGVSQANLHYYHNDNSNALSLRPAVMHDSKAGDPMWFVDQVNGKTTIEVFKMTNVLSSSATFFGTQLTVAPYEDIHLSGVYPKQPNGTTVTTNQDSRIQKVAEAGNLLVASQAVNVSSTENDARWYEIDVSSGTPVLKDQGNVSAGNDTYIYYPAIDINSSGDIGMTYMQSGTDTATDFMSMWLTGRTPTDTAGTMQTPLVAKAGVANYTDQNVNGPQAGDFSGISSDSDGSFFAVSEYATNRASGNWGTEVAHFTLSASSASPPTAVYVNSAWSGFSNGQSIPDANPVVAGNQSAVFGSTAFATVGAALAAVAPGGTVYVNSGSYASEAVDLTGGDTLALLGTAQGVPGTVTFGSLTTAAGTTVDTGSVGSLDNTLQQGSLATSTTVAGLISGPGNLSIQGGTLSLTDSGNSYAGGTTVSGGTLLVDGAAGSGSVTVDSGATVGGTGTIAGALVVSAGGTVSPGDPTSGTSKLAAGPLTLLGTYTAQINGAASAGTSYDQLDVSGASAVAAGSLAVTLGYAPSPGDTITLLSGSGTVTGPLSINGAVVNEGGEVALSFGGASYNFKLSYANDKLTLTLDTSPTINVDNFATGLNNTVNLSTSGGNTLVTVDGITVFDEPTADITGLTLSAATDNDTFNVLSIGVATTINGGTGNDTFNVTGPLATGLTIAGGQPATPPGDTINFNAGTQPVTVSAGSVTQAGSGTLAYSSIARLQFSNDGGVTVQATSNVPNGMTVQRDLTDNTLNDVTLDGGPLITVSTASSLNYEGGGTASNQVTINEDANGLPLFKSTAAGAHTNAAFTSSGPSPASVGVNIAGGGNGTTSIVFNFTGTHDVIGYSDNVAATGSGVVAIAGALNVSFSGLTSLDYNGAGGSLTLSDAANPSVASLTVSDPTPGGGETVVSGNGTWAAARLAGFGSLIVQGDNAQNNTITLQTADSASTSGHALANVTLQGGSGNDTISVDSLAATITATLLGGEGSNVFSLDESGGGHNLATVAGTVNISPAGDSTSATDTLNLNDSGHAGNRTVTVTQTTITGITGTGTSTIRYDGSGRIETVNIAGGNAGNEFDIQGTNPSVTNGYAIDTGRGADTVNISSDAPANTGTLANIQSPVFLNTQGGGDSLTVSDLGSASAVYTLEAGVVPASTTLSTSHSANITYDANGIAGQLAHFSLIGAAAGQNTYNIGLTSATVSNTVADGDATGTGGSTFNIQANQLQAGSANTFNGNKNNNTFNLNYAADASTSSAAGTTLAINAGTTGNPAQPNVVNINTTADTSARTVAVNYPSAAGGAIAINGLGTDSAALGVQISAAQHINFFGGAANADHATVTGPASTMFTVTQTAAGSIDVSPGNSQPDVDFNGIQGTNLVVSGASSELSFTGDGKADVTIDLGARTVAETGFAPVSFAGVGTVNINAAGAAVKVVGTTGDDRLAVTPTGANSATAQDNGTGAVFDFTSAKSLAVDLAGGNNTLVVNGSAYDDQIVARTNASANPTVTVAQGANGDLPIAYIAADLSALDINGLAGDDTLTVDSSNGPFTTPIVYDGGNGNNSIGLIDMVHTGVSATYVAGPLAGQASETLNFGTVANPEQQIVQFSNLSAVYDSVPGTLAVPGTSGNDTIDYREGDDTTGKASAAWGQVTVDDLTPLNFSGQTSLTISTGSGNDTVNITDASTPRNLAAVAVNGTSAADTINFTASSVGAVSLNLQTNTVAEAGFAPFSFAGVGTVNINAAGAAVNVVGTTGDDSLAVTPTGANSATAQDNGTGAVLNFTSAKSLAVDLAGGNNTLVVNGPANDDQIVARTNASGNPVVTVAQGANVDLPIAYVAADLNTLDIKGLGSDDTLTVDSSHGALTTPIVYDGGSGNNSISLIDTVHAGVAATYVAGPLAGQGSETLNFGTVADPEQQVVQFSNLSAVYDSVPGTLTVPGTSGNDTIDYREGDDSTGKVNAAWGQVVVNGQEAVNFTNKSALAINPAAGGAAVLLDNPSTPASLTNIVVDGSSNNNVTLTAHTVPGTSNSFVVTPTAAGSGTLTNVAQTQPAVNYAGLAQLNVVARTTDTGQQLIYTGTSGNDTYELTPGATGDSGKIVGSEAGAGGFDFVPLLFSGFNPTIGAAAIGLGSAFGHGVSGGNDTAIIDGTVGSGTFAIQASSVFTNANAVVETVAGVGHVEVAVDPTRGVANVVLRSAAGNEVVNVSMPTVQPAISYSIEGTKLSGATTTLNYTSPAASSTTVDLAAGTVGAAAANPLSFTNLTTLNLNANGGTLTIADSTAGTGVNVTPTGPQGGTAAATGTATVVDFSETTSLSIDLSNAGQVSVHSQTPAATFVADEPTRTILLTAADGTKLVPVVVLRDVPTVELDGGIAGSSFIVVPAPGVLPSSTTDVVGQPNFQLPDNLKVAVVGGGSAVQNSLLIANYNRATGTSSPLDSSLFALVTRSSSTAGVINLLHNNGPASGPNEYPAISYSNTAAVNVETVALTGTLSSQTVTNWLSHLYLQLLNRVPALAELTYWMSQVQEGESLSAVASAFVVSDEYRGDQINLLYQKYLGRNAEADGIAYWTSIWNATGGPEEVQAGIIGSAEFYAHAGSLYPALSPDAAWVTALYHDLLGREPDSAGLAAWVNFIQTNTRESVVIGFVTSDEFRLNLVNRLFQTYLGRSLDPTSAQAFLAAMHVGLTQDEVLTIIVSSDEYVEKVP